jgi:cystathionine beta-lyase/cystathionine gamma-synthase
VLAIAARTPNAFMPSQFTNPENPRAHYLGTGPEIWEDSRGEVDVLVGGVGTGGTISGTGVYLKERKPSVRVVVADPPGSILSGGDGAPWTVEGIGEDFFPETFDRVVIDEYVQVTDAESFRAARTLVRREGLFCGGSSGTALAAALKYARAHPRPMTIVVLLPDTGTQLHEQMPLRRMDEGARVSRRGGTMKDGTLAVHAGQVPDPATGAVVPPIVQSSTFAQSAPGEPLAGYEYTRAGNPNFAHLEETLAALEVARCATVFSSGLGALTAWLLQAGPSHVVACQDVYGGTYRLLTQVFANFGVTTSFVASEDPAAWDAAIRPDTRWLPVETPTNPLLKLLDIEALSALAHGRGVRVLVDNTFATPCLQKPLLLGADAVIHSTTKYLGGHSDVIGGVLVTNDDIFKERADFFRKAAGLNPSPFDCWLTSRGIKTLAVRMERHEANARAVAELLAASGRVEKVFYPGLHAHPQRDLAGRQMAGFGGIVSVRFPDATKARAFLAQLNLFRLAESLGGVESLVCQPSTMTHASMPRAMWEAGGITDALVRLSVGIEDPADLMNDVAQALEA